MNTYRLLRFLQKKLSFILWVEAYSGSRLAGLHCVYLNRGRGNWRKQGWERNSVDYKLSHHLNCQRYRSFLWVKWVLGKLTRLEPSCWNSRKCRWPTGGPVRLTGRAAPGGRGLSPDLISQVMELAREGIPQGLIKTSYLYFIRHWEFGCHVRTAHVPRKWVKNFKLCFLPFHLAFLLPFFLYFPSPSPHKTRNSR